MKAANEKQSPIVADDYEQCGTCGYDHEYDSIDRTAREQIAKAHENDEG